MANNDKPPIGKVAGIALAGTSIEWYDFFLYGTAAALVFPALFFPKDLPPLLALLASFATFAVGFIARPLGGIIFGHFGDKRGRKSALVVALVLMGTATTFIGFLPSYATSGPIATLLLIACRFVQGLAIGGQWGGAMLLVTESAPPKRRGFYGSFAQVGAPVGVLLANAVFLSVSVAMPPEDFMSWGWRLPFIFSALLIGLALYIHLRLEETPSFRRLNQLREQRQHDLMKRSAVMRQVSISEIEAELAVDRRPSPVLDALKSYPREIALVAGAFLAIQVSFYILTTFVIAYGTQAATLGLSRNTMLLAVLVGAAAMIPGVIGGAIISDNRGRRGVYAVGAALLAVWSFAIFPLIATGSLLWIAVAIGVGQFLVGLMYGPQAAFLTEIFSTRVRYSGVSLGYQFGAIVGGAIAPLVATSLLAKFGSPFWISVYMATACVITLFCVLMLPETYRGGLDEPPAPEAILQSPVNPRSAVCDTPTRG